jgi:ubiquinone/menaquinone biosynthesis C-methylase UbiE|tara:strand:+ start:155 stop:934 length:780 start_codon:yes stop_codon:yes gene_type:complete
MASEASTLCKEPDDAVATRTNGERWHDIWLRKGSSTTSLSLHHINGFLQINDEQYATLVKTVADPIGIQDGWSVLDCGCGAGAFLRQLKRQYGCRELAGVDYSASMVEVAKASLEVTDDSLHIGTICNLSRWGDATFDCVVCFSVYFYLSSVEDAKQALREAIRVCKPGGAVYIGDVSDLAKHDLAMELRGETHKDQPKLSSDNPVHMYLPQSLFTEIAEELEMVNLRFVDHDSTPLVEYYDTAPYRFSVYMNKPADLE